MKKIKAMYYGAAGSVAVLQAGSAQAAQDYTGVQTALVAEVTAAMPTVLQISGLVLAIALGLRLIKKAAHS